jgi:membrane-associated phospholipid phosphatase
VAGKHFWTDVIAGAALGVGVGLLVPYLHEVVAKKNRLPGNASIIVSPSVVEGGGGAVVTLIK